MALRRAGRFCHRYATTHHQKSARSRDRRIACHAQRIKEKSSKMTVSAARSRVSTTSNGPRSPSMIYRCFSTSKSWTPTHSSRGVATSPRCQKTLSSSTTGSPVISPRRFARVDLPDAPRPRITTRLMLYSVHAIRSLGLRTSRTLGTGEYLSIDA
jgi:hypothetical protein